MPLEPWQGYRLQSWCYGFHSFSSENVFGMQVLTGRSSGGQCSGIWIVRLASNAFIVRLSKKLQRGEDETQINRLCVNAKRFSIG